MANITQFVRQQSHRDVFNRQFSEDLDERLEMADFYGGGEHAEEKRKSFRKKALEREEKRRLRDQEREQRKRQKIEEKLRKVAEQQELELTSRSSQNFLSPYMDGGNDLASISRVSSVSQFSERPEDGAEDKETWDSKVTFILATIGYAVGLGNVWRFPYLAQKNGGGAFLIPYWLMLFVEGLPIFLLELAIGQRLRKGSIGAWNRVSPYLGGIGIASGVVSLNVALYYNTIISWCLYYFVNSFTSPLPWSECPTEQIEANFTATVKECQVSSPTQYFWYRETLNISDDIDNPNNFNWIIATCLLSAWVLVYLCVVKGITESPAIIWITAIYPYVVLIIFFFRAITLEEKWEKLSEPIVWLEAGTQIFFSLGLGFGGLIAYSSYNPTNNNCLRDALVVAFTNCFTSMFAGIVIFAIMGFKAHTVHKKCLDTVEQALSLAFNETGRPFAFPQDGLLVYTDSQGFLVNVTLPTCNLEEELENSASGTGLAFILFTEAVNQFPFGNLWAVLFFLMLFTLGLDSQFGTVQGVVQCLVDLKLFPNTRKEIVTGLLCLTCFVVALIFSHGSGNYIFTLFDNFSGTIPLLVIALCECLAVSYIYGLRRFARDIELMTGSRPSLYWLICWRYVSPLAMSIILLASLIQVCISGAGYVAWNPDTGTSDPKEWPIWAKCLIVFLISISILWIPAVWILKKLGFSVLSEEGAGWFPAEELRQFYGLPMEYKVSRAEKVLLGFNDDGTEGICFKFKPDTDYYTPPTFI